MRWPGNFGHTFLICHPTCSQNIPAHGQPHGATDGFVDMVSGVRAMVATIVAWVDVSSHARRNNTVAISNTLTPFPQLEGGWLPPNMRNEKHLVTQPPIE